MHAIVLKPFAYAHDGINPVPLSVGSGVVKINDNVASGLIAAGYIAEAKIEEEIEIIDAWEFLTWPDRLKLAKAIDPQNAAMINTKDEAHAVIKAELERRANAKAS